MIGNLRKGNGGVSRCHIIGENCENGVLQQGDVSQALLIDFRPNLI